VFRCSATGLNNSSTAEPALNLNRDDHRDPRRCRRLRLCGRGGVCRGWRSHSTV